MELLLTRTTFLADKTFGQLYLTSPAPEETLLKGMKRGQPTEQGLLLCDTLEPTRRNLAGGARKINGRTAIPEGRYPLVVAYSPKFRRWLPTLVGVPGFKGIRIHPGNTENDTRGCILVGRATGNSCLVFSRDAFLRLMHLLDHSEPPKWITISAPTLQR